MATYRVPRSTKGDLPFRLKDRPGGNLIDPYGYVNGTTHAEFPTAVILNGVLADVTASWAVNLAAETLPVGAKKDPTNNTGVWRLSQGQERIRINPAAGQPFGNYILRVTFPTSATTSFTEDSDIVLIDAGDVEFGDLVFAGLTWEDLTAGIQSSITDPDQQELILAEMAATVEGDLQLCGIDTSTFTELPKAIRAMLLAYGRLLLFTYDTGAGTLPTEIQEGSERIKFGGRGDAGATRWMDDYQRRLTAYCKMNAPGRQPMMGTIVKPVGMTTNDPDQSPMDFGLDV